MRTERKRDKERQRSRIDMKGEIERENELKGEVERHRWRGGVRIRDIRVFLMLRNNRKMLPMELCPSYGYTTSMI